MEGVKKVDPWETTMVSTFSFYRKRWKAICIHIS